MNGYARYSTGSGTPRRGARKATKKDKEAQEALKKTTDLVEELAGKDNACVYVLDKTGIRLESRDSHG